MVHVTTLDDAPERMPVDDFSYGIEVTGLDPASLNDALKAAIADAMADPLRMGTWISGLALAEQNVGLNMLRRLSGQEAVTPFAPAGPDKRFSEPEWTSNPMLAGIVEDYRVRSQAALSLVDSARLPEATRRKARFAMQLDARRVRSQQRAVAQSRRREGSDGHPGPQPAAGHAQLSGRRAKQRRVSAPGRRHRASSWARISPRRLGAS